MNILTRYAWTNTSKAHIVFEYNGVGLPRSLCGRTPEAGWAMTSNVPGDRAVCKQCQVVAQKQGDALRLEFVDHLVSALFGRHAGWFTAHTLKDYLHICELYERCAKK